MTAIQSRIEQMGADDFPELVPDSFIPKYGDFDERRHLANMERIGTTLLMQGRVTSDEVDASISFTERAHAMFSGRVAPDSGSSFAFAVPTRVTRASGSLYSSEIAPFLPIAKALSGKELLYLADGMPPCVIESYATDDDGKQGRVLFVPLFGDILDDMQRGPKHLLGNKIGTDVGNLRARRVARRVINQAAEFVRNELGADVMGLGAVLPALTDYGRTINVEGLTTTTGHGGTVALIANTVGRIREGNSELSDSIGVVGAAGSIGRSSLAELLKAHPDASFTVNDTRSLDRVMGQLSDVDAKRVRVVSGMDKVFDRSSVIVSAITDVIDLQEVFPDLDLSGKIIVDDSQPGAFSRTDVESKGGRLLWVVGEDVSPNGLATRVGGYTFGSDTGFMHNTNVWGCEAEASSISRTGRHDLAVRSVVTPEIARSINNLFEVCDIEIANYQSFGKPVELW